MHPNTTRRLAAIAKSDACKVTYRGCVIYRAGYEADRPWVWDGIAFTALQADSYPTLQAAKAGVDAYLGDDRDYFVPEEMPILPIISGIVLASAAAMSLILFFGGL